MSAVLPPESRADATVLDVRGLPSVVFGPRSLMWWGTIGLMLIEGTIFALGIATYFYLRSHNETWPPAEGPPKLLWGTLQTVVMLVSVLPAMAAKKAAQHYDTRGVRLWLTVSTLFSLACLAIRWRELGFENIQCWWDSSAYGSIVWLLLGLHTTHLVTDAWDTLVLNVLFFTGPLEGKRFGDVSENAMYWYFVVFSWLPIYAVLYFAPRGT
jgi:heme/copper-type cytochrome/quinol oxidase subunit 3